MRWLKFATAYLMLASIMIVMLSERAERSWVLAAMWAAAVHWFSGVLIIMLAGPMGLSLPDGWHRLRPWETDGSIYHWFGIEPYRKALLASPFGPNAFLKFEGRRAQFPELEQFTRNAEMGHLTLLVASAGATAVALLTGYSRTAFFLTVVNVPWNVYPVLLQRYTRARLQGIRRRFPTTSRRATL
jgi:hypothetical protein